MTSAGTLQETVRACLPTHYDPEQEKNTAKNGILSHALRSKTDKKQ